MLIFLSKRLVFNCCYNNHYADNPCKCNCLQLNDPRYSWTVAIPDEDIADFWFLVRKSASLMDRAGETLFREGLGISMSQFMVLSVIDAHPGNFNQQSVADLLGLTKGTVSRQIDTAVEAGLVNARVSSTSRREKTIELTSAGTALVRKGDALLATSNSGLFPNLNRGDLAATLRTLRAFTAGMDAAPQTLSDHLHH
jgi:DNA-binding MarR family transcriptional regulator